MKLFEFLESSGVSSHAMFVLELSIVTLWLIIIIIKIIIIIYLLITCKYQFTFSPARN